jgi:hypothetical protein
VLQATEEMDLRIRAADVHPVDDARERVPVHEQLAHVEVAVADRGVAGRRERPCSCDERRSVHPELLQPRQANVHVHPAERIGRQRVADRGEHLRRVQRAQRRAERHRIDRAPRRLDSV